MYTLTILWRILVLAALPVHGYGELGHRTVAYLAEKYLTDDAVRLVNALLANDRGYDISDAALWTDGRVRNERPETRQWHWIDAQDTPPMYCNVSYKRDCGSQGAPGCVVSAITDLTKVIYTPSETHQARKEALMFVIHFLGDVHQPLHVENVERGGNGIPVCFDGDCSDMNLHKVWDTMIPRKSRDLGSRPSREAEKDAAAQWADELFAAQAAADVGGVARMAGECVNIETAQKCAVKWAEESNDWICDYVLKEGVDGVKGKETGTWYYDGAFPIVDELIGKAGVRLGAWINAIAIAANAEGAFATVGEDQVVLAQPQDL